MIAKFFSKSNPIHFVITSLVLLIVFTITIILSAKQELSVSYFLKQCFLFGVCFFSLFIFDFLIGKNNLTKKNSYHLLFFCLFIILIPQTFLEYKILIANLFILFALRRIISMRSKKYLKKKLFDAAFWITLAALLSFWAAMFYILIFAALFVYKISDVKNWIIPFLGILTVLIIGFCAILLLNQPIMPLGFYIPEVSFDFSTLNANHIIIASTIYFTYFLWSLIFYLKNLKSKSKNYKASYVLILIAALIALTIIILKPEKSGAEFLFLMAPLAIIVANYIELIQERWFREVLIWILILAPTFGLVL